jgi:lantibiotic modifying enzyme
LFNPFLTLEKLSSKNDESVSESIFCTALLQRPPVAFDAFNSAYMAAFQQPVGSFLDEQMPMVRNDRTDNMIIFFEANFNKERKRPPSLAFLNEDAMQLEDYLTEFCEGYVLASKEVMANKAALLDIFFAAEKRRLRCRLVLRQTMLYYEILWKLNQPSLLQDVKNRRIHIENMLIEMENPTLIIGEQKLRNLIKYECDCLLKGNIPILFFELGSNLLIFGSYTMSLEPPPCSLALRLSHFTKEGNIGRALEVVSDLFSEHGYQFLPIVSVGNFLNELLSEYIVGISSADVLFKNDVENAGTDYTTPEDELSLNLRLSVHDGLAGCLICVCAIYLCLKDVTYEQYCARLFDDINKELVRGGLCKNIGGGYGFGSIIYSYAFAGVALRDKEKSIRAFFIFKRVNNEMKSAELHIDVKMGLAGYGMSLIALLDAAAIVDALSSSEFSEVYADILKCGKLLYTQNFADKKYLSKTSYKTGFSHGSSGIAYAFAVLFHLCEDDVFRQAVHAIMSFEDAYISSNKSNWLHQENIGNAIEYYDRCQWCHGAPGIILARRAINNIHGNPFALGKRARARMGKGCIKFTFSTNIPKTALEYVENHVLYDNCVNDTLCCGSFGCLECIFSFECPKYDDGLAVILKNIARRGLRIHPSNLGLFQGKGGLIYHLLEKLYPNVLGSFLLWEIPSQI